MTRRLLFRNPLAQPVPVVPNLRNEPIFTCLLRLYSVRRDVTSFFRLIWRPSLPSIITTLEICVDINYHNKHAFKNLLSVAQRILDSTFHENAINLSFPHPIKVIAKEIFAVAGNNALHTFLLNFLILPNLVKILKGDHDSIENEYFYSGENINKMLNLYYNLDLWWPVEGYDKTPFNPVNTLIWLVWRLYSGAALLDHGTIAVLTSQGFFAGGPVSDTSKIPDQVTRSMLVRLQSKLDIFCKYLLSDQPGITRNQQSNKLQMNNHSQYQMYDKIPSLSKSGQFKKSKEMLTMMILSKSEIIIVFQSLLHVDITNASGMKDLFRSIREYLYLCNQFYSNITNHSSNDLFLLPLSKYSGSCNNDSRHYQSEVLFYSDIDNVSEYDDMMYDKYGSSEQLLHATYTHLCRSLNLANYYEDSLIHNIELISVPYNKSSFIDKNAIKTYPSEIIPSYNIRELKVLIHDRSWYHCPEFDHITAHQLATNNLFKTNTIDLYEKHTEAFLRKTRDSHRGLSALPTSYFDIQVQRSKNLLKNKKGIDFSKDDDKSALSKYQEAEKSLRFGDSSPSISIYTGIERSKYQEQFQLAKLQSISSVSNNSSKIPSKPKNTTSINPNSHLLELTQAVRNVRVISRPNRFDEDKEFMSSMRTHEILPTHHFFQKRSTRSYLRNSRVENQQNINNIHGKSINNSSNRNSNRSSINENSDDYNGQGDDNLMPISSTNRLANKPLTNAKYNTNQLQSNNAVVDKMMVGDKKESRNKTVPLPFPEHLKSMLKNSSRTIIHESEEEYDNDYVGEDEYGDNDYDDTDENYHNNESNDVDNPVSNNLDVSQLIQDYQSLFHSQPVTSKAVQLSTPNPLERSRKNSRSISHDKPTSNPAAGEKYTGFVNKKAFVPPGRHIVVSSRSRSPRFRSNRSRLSRSPNRSLSPERNEDIDSNDSTNGISLKQRLLKSPAYHNRKSKLPIEARGSSMVPKSPYDKSTINEDDRGMNNGFENDGDIQENMYDNDDNLEFDAIDSNQYNSQDDGNSNEDTYNNYASSPSTLTSQSSLRPNLYSVEPTAQLPVEISKDLYKAYRSPIPAATSPVLSRELLQVPTTNTAPIEGHRNSKPSLRSALTRPLSTELTDQSDVYDNILRQSAASPTSDLHTSSYDNTGDTGAISGYKDTI